MDYLKQKYFSSIILSLVLLVLLLVASACSTQKNTFINRNYHSITTKYNGYFNARESYRQGLKRLTDVHEDNYEDVLSVFRYGSEQQMRSVASNMDIAYQKASTAIRRHSMNIRGVEYNRWIDDSYYLIARSHYFKRDFNLAILTFEYIIRQYDTPLKYKSMIWVAKSYIQTGQYDNARQALERVNRNIQEGNLDKEAQLLYNMVSADFHLQQQNYAQASPYLKRGTELTRSRRQRTRLTFILAQSYHQERNYALAQQTYTRVLKLNPDFEMAFQARINMAMAFDTQSGDESFILSELQGMLRDSKNRDFRDQIYYALAQFSMRQRKEDAAIDYYYQALDNHRGNNSQKGLSFLRLGEIQFERKNYVQAAAYYDSTMVYLSREYPQYTEARDKNVLLKELATYINVTQREDSLQRLAGMNAAQRNAILDGIIAEMQEKERLEREREQERARMRQDMVRHGRGQTPGASEGGWYFYNPSAMSFGRNEFYAKWGERELEDLWRISNKQVMAFGDMGDFDMMDGEAQPAAGRVTRNTLLENVPTTPEKMDASNARMAQAYYNKGVLFKDRLQDYPSAISSFEALITRFPQNERRLYSAYFLYTLYQNMGNTARADSYKNLIINDFPDTDFARILADPNYAENVRNRQSRVKEVYARAYEAYIAGNYDRAMELCLQSDTLEKNLEQEARFSFLKALITGKTSEQDEFIRELTFVKEHYTGTDVHQPAENLLAYLGADAAMMVTDAQDETARGREDARRERGALPLETVFTYRPEAVHFYVMVVSTRNLPVRQLRSDINTFNSESMQERNLNLSTLFFDDGRQLITVTNFPDAEQAMAYGRKLNTAIGEKDYEKEHYTGFVISVDNYPVFYQERKLKDYLEFYEAAYGL